MVNKSKHFSKNINFILLSCIFTFLFSISFVSAVHNITNTSGGTTITVPEDVSRIINITVNNTDAGQNANLTQVNITIPSSFNFTASTNGTNLTASEYNLTVSGILSSWINSTTYLINGSRWSYFWVNVTAPTPGNYNITVTTVNLTSTYSSNLTVTITDTTAPSAITFQNQTPSDGANLSQSYIKVNLSATDNVLVSTIRFYLYNSTGLVNNTNSTSNSALVNFTGLANAIYYVNATANDTTNNVNTSSGTLTITLDTTNPNITLITPSNATDDTATAYHFTFNMSSDLSGIVNCSLIIDGSIVNTSTNINTSTTMDIYNGSFATGTHNWSINCTDYAGNIGNTTNRVLIVSAASSSSSSSSSSSGGSSTPSIWKNTFVADDKELSEKGIITRDLADDNRVKLKISSKTHYVGVTSLTISTATIEVSSTPQQATLNIGSNKKFDVDENGYYDIIVKLNSIKDNKANIAIESINEKIPVAEPQKTIGTNNEVVNQQPTKEPESSSINQSKNAWTIGIIIIVVLIALIAYYLMSKKKSYR